MKCLQRSFISLDGCVSFCEKFAGRGGREFDVSPNKVRFCITQEGGGRDNTVGPLYSSWHTSI